MALKQDGVNFVLCPKQGNKIEGFSQTGYVFKDFFLPKQGQGFKPSATNLYPNISRVVEYPPPPPHTWRSFALTNRVETTSLVCEEKHYPVFARAQKLLWCEHILKFMSIAFWSSILLSEVLNTDPRDIDMQWRIQDGGRTALRYKITCDSSASQDLPRMYFEVKKIHLQGL